LCCDALSVEQEAHARNVLSLTVAESVHELAECGGALDFEEDLIVVVGNLDVQVFALSTVFGLLLNVGRTVVRHICGSSGFRWLCVWCSYPGADFCLMRVSEQVGRLSKCKGTDLLVGRAAFIV
jgi:hypothetical protein